MNGESLVPFLTTDKPEHRQWIYGYHKEMQLIRGKNILIDGKNTVYDVSEYPNDLISFPVVKDWSKVSKKHKSEYKMLKNVLPRFDLHATEHDAPINRKTIVSSLLLKNNDTIVKR